MPGKSQPRGRGKGKPFKPGDSRAGRKPGSKNKATIQARETARALLEDSEYRANLRTRLNRGDAAPAVEAMLWHYAYGKPADKVEMTGADGAPLTTALPVLVEWPSARTHEDPDGGGSDEGDQAAGPAPTTDPPVEPSE